MNRNLPATTPRTPARGRVHSFTGRLWWLLPPAAALLYPSTLKVLYESGKLLHGVSGRHDTITKVDTNFLWASGAPVGLLPDAWNVRLIPHYSLGVWFVITHMGLGLRGVLLAHQVSPSLADRAAWAVSTLGAAVALTITIAQLSVHGAS